MTPIEPPPARTRASSLGVSKIGCTRVRREACEKVCVRRWSGPAPPAALELLSTTRLKSGQVALHYRRKEG
jgi:hypothetical protein